MSGAAKDDRVAIDIGGEDAAAPVGADSAGLFEEHPAEAGGEASEAEGRLARRAAPHLRVVAENAAPLAAEEADPSEVRAGAAIRSARENLGLELEQVSRETRIHINHLRAIEDMTPSLLGAPVYAKGYIRNYARYLRLDPEATLARYLRECAILADPQKQEIAAPAQTRARPARPPVLALVACLLLIGAGLAWFLTGRSAAPPTPTGEAAVSAPPAAETPSARNTAQTLRIVAVSRARIEVRGADGTKFLARSFSPGESYTPRVGAGWTVTTTDGAAFEWRLGDVSLGLLAPEGGPVYAQSVDLALARQPVITESVPVAAPVSVPAGPPRPAARDPARAPAAAAAAPAAPADIGTPAVAPPAPGAAPEEVDPSLLAYPSAPAQ